MMLELINYAENSFSGLPSIVSNKKGKLGLIDESGNTVLKPKYDTLEEIQEGFYVGKIIRKKIKGRVSEYARTIACLINSKGKIITPPKEYKSIKSIPNFNNLFLCTIYNNEALIDASGNDKGIVSNYKQIGDFLFVKFIFPNEFGYSDKYKYKVFNKNGFDMFGKYFQKYESFCDKSVFLKPDTNHDLPCLLFNIKTGSVVENLHFITWDIFDNMALICESVFGKVGIINPEGEFIFEYEYTKIDVLDYYGIGLLFLYKKENSAYAFANFKGDILTDFKFIYSDDKSYPAVIRHFPKNLNLISALKNDYYSFCLLNQFGEELVKAETAIEYKYLDSKNDLGLVDSKDLGAFIFVRETGEDIKGKQVYISDERKKGKWGYVNSSGKLKLYFEYDSIEKLTPNAVKIVSNGRIGIFSITEGIIREPRYETVSLNRFEDGKYYIDATVNGDKEKIVLKDYQSEKQDNISFKKQLYDYNILGEDGKLSVEDKNGKVLFSDVEEVVDVSKDKLININDIFIAKKDGKYGFIFYTGIVAYPFELDNAESFVNGYSVVSMDGKKGIIDTKGKLVVKFTHSNIVLE